MATIAIVGAGFSGTLMALHLLQRCSPSTRVHLIERNRRFGPGAAYSTGNASHLLNVRAGRMSAFRDDPDHFLDWLNAEGRGVIAGGVVGSTTFVPRQVYGAYIRQLLLDELRRLPNRGRLRLSRGNVLSIDEINSGLVLQVDRNRRINADIAVLAIGNFPPAAPPGIDAANLEPAFYQADPWRESAAPVASDAAVLLIGTGLTMIDSAISLLDRGHRGPIHALSRRGLMPTPHRVDGGQASPNHQAYPTHLTPLFQNLRAECAKAESAGVGWQSTIDRIRPFTQDIWQSFSAEDRARFLRHLRPWWDVHRHRLAPLVAQRINYARAAGQIQVHAGRIRHVQVFGDQLHLTFRRRQSGTMETLAVSRIINCSGPGYDYDRVEDPLVRSLLARGQVRTDPLQLGLDVSANCALKGSDGAISQRLFAIGPVTKGTFWEIVAVPDIRHQCESLGAFLAAHVGTHVAADHSSSANVLRPKSRSRSVSSALPVLEPGSQNPLPSERYSETAEDMYYI
jgi:uncharacterized NAD(P)/FAD-binding protein YdhS